MAIFRDYVILSGEWPLSSKREWLQYSAKARAVGKVQYIDPNRYILARYSVSRSSGSRSVFI